ncbi:MAG: heparinase II/III family protein [Verrucomicrobia bacterium]|nr:heparinase II/III family protein [Verrucomicrobiota bacterium]
MITSRQLLNVSLAFLILAITGGNPARAASSQKPSKPKRAAAPSQPVDAGRVKAVAAMLPEQPVGGGRPIGERTAWARLAAGGYREHIGPAARDIIKRAETILSQPVPELPDDLYLDFSRTGNRTRWQKVAFERRGRLTWLVLAECLENKGRFLPKMEELIAAFCAEKCWVMPAHDRRLTNFNGTFVDVDLASSALAWNLATTDWLLGDNLGAATRKLLREKVRKFVLDPCLAAYRGTRRLDGWMKTTNNWNAVCLAGVTGAALALLDSREERALFVAAAEQFSKSFLAGFTPDGYCSEGLGYWNYGFGHYVLLSETVCQATGGKLDLFARPEAKAPAEFGARIQIIGGVAPAFADCSVNANPSPEIMWFVNRRLGLGLSAYDKFNAGDEEFTGHWFGFLFESALYSFPNSASQAKRQNSGRDYELGLRTWFDSAGILIGRPAPGSPCRMGVALKGGHNAEHHNHNDVGSYVVVVGKRAVLLDPGAETYTARTFSKDRYVSKLLNSFGHPVPLVAGKLQREGRDAQGKVLRTEFTDRADTLALDIASPYSVPELKRLERTFVYSRDGAGSLTVTDTVEFASPQTFGTALVTLGKWERDDDGILLVSDGGEAVRVEVSVKGGEFAVQAEEIVEDAPVKPTRIGINLTQPVTAATVTLRITPTGKPKL